MIGKGLVIGLILLAAVVGIGLLLKRRPPFTDYETLPSGELSEAQKHTLSMVTEINKFLVSLSTLMFGVLGFYLSKYETVIRGEWIIKVAYLASFIFLGAMYYFAAKVYSQSISELAQNAQAIKPRKSLILYYLEMEFTAAMSSSIILLSIFVYVILS